jgi:5-methylcytosine-specific restriction endonuclease McrA
LWYTGGVSEQYIRKPNTSCLVCGKEIYRRPVELKRNNGRVFCGGECYGKSCRKERPCIVCGKLILSGLNKKTCSRGCANTHRKGIQYKINSPRDKVKTLRIIKIRLFDDRGKKCERCGYDGYEILQIHHKDKNKFNNKPDNLEVVCPNCHAKEHFLDSSWARQHYR